jgi:carboxyl-terminal processing protease
MRQWEFMKYLAHFPLFLTLVAITGYAAAQEAPVAGESKSAPGSAQLNLDDLRTFTDVFNQVRRNYVEDVDDRRLLEAAIDGMLSDLDPHSAYLPDRDFADLEDISNGEYVGIGVDVAIEDGRVVVKTVIVPSPADAAGIRPGDRITSIDGIAVKGHPLQESIDRLSGPQDSILKLTVSRAGEDARNLTLKRGHVKLPALDFKLLDQHYGYLRLVYFHRDSAVDFKNALDSIQTAGTELYGLILDLRDNPGGVLQPAIEMADGFLDQGEIVSMRGRNAAMQSSFSARQGQWLPGLPMVVLVDRGTASASEVLAGALQDHKRAVIVGERTFGKGSVQTVLPLRNGSGIKLTTARYFTPSGKSIQAQGIEPDLAVASAVEVIETVDDRLLEADLDRHLENPEQAERKENTTDVDASTDFPLFEALNLLRANRILAGNEITKLNQRK